MKFTKLLFVLAVTTTVIFACMWGGTYAWYTANNKTSVNATTGNLDTGVAVIFTQTEYVNTVTGVPILPADVDDYADKTVFTLVPDSQILNGYETSINISLVNVTVDDSLKISDFKYKLDCNDGTRNIALNSGTGTDIPEPSTGNPTDGPIILGMIGQSSSTINLGSLTTSAGTLDITKTYTCTLRVWLEDTGVSQNDLMNKKFQGVIKVSSVFRK